jgi:uncharacterized protein YdeI (YjbR/CyaY-like superfamily)
MEQYDSRVDAYIEKSAEFAKPILTHLRNLVHQASPELKETMKWSSPFFDYEGPVCQIAAFKQHCAFGFWKAKLMDDPHQILNQQPDTAGSIGKITSLADLPADEILIRYIQEAIALNVTGTKVPVKPKAKVSAALEVPADFSDLLRQQPLAAQHFEQFSPSQKKEYLSWFDEAKTEATRAKRMTTAVEWISEGKIRNWKYK